MNIYNAKFTQLYAQNLEKEVKQGLTYRMRRGDSGIGFGGEGGSLQHSLSASRGRGAVREARIFGDRSNMMIDGVSLGERERANSAEFKKDFQMHNSSFSIPLLDKQS